MLHLVPVRFKFFLNYSGHSEKCVNHNNIADLLQSKHISETTTEVKE